ncbi:MAG: SHOCT domain-containing protein [Cellulomonas sp.]|nr:SHOCT domain-containing protein [Cellulomonas sp.]
MMGWYGMGMGWGAWLGMGRFWLVLLGVILYAVVRLLPSGRAGGRDRGADSPAEILDRRFARGEIDIETYRAQRAALFDGGAR